MASNAGVVGGAINLIPAGQDNSGILFGSSNTVRAVSAAILGGTSNSINATNAVIAGGVSNTIFGAADNRGIIAGGTSNGIAGSVDGSIIGGRLNTLSTSNSSTMLGGNSNTMSSSADGAIIGGRLNSMSASNSSAILGGISNTIINGQRSVILSGENNRVTNSLNLVFGSANTCSGFLSCAVGGNQNTVATGGGASGILAGARNTSNAFFTGMIGGEGNSTGANHMSALGGTGLTGATQFMTMVGRFNANTGAATRLFVVGNGTTTANRLNAFSVSQDNIIRSPNAIAVGGADYSEYFEAECEKHIPAGTSVILLPNRKVRAARKGDNPIGIISSMSSIIGNDYSEFWKGKYMRDPETGEFLKDMIKINKEVDEYKDITETIEEDKIEFINGKYIRKQIEKTVTRRIQVFDEYPLYDENNKIVGVIRNPRKKILEEMVEDYRLSPDFDPNKEYIPRSSRPEWNVVGLVGVVKILPNQPINNRWVLLENGFCFIR